MFNQKAYNQKYYQEHKEYFLAYAKKYVRENKEKHAVCMKRWQQKNPKKLATCISRWQQKNPEKLKANTVRWQKAHPEKLYAGIRKYTLRQKYGISVEDYQSLFDNQNGCCAICGKHQDQLKVKLSIDHDHNTKHIRGLLCINCNTLLGHALDSPKILQQAIMYLNGKVLAT